MINKKKKKYIKRIANDSGCLHCRSFEELQFHHKDPSKKSYCISELLKKNASFKSINKEIKKCIILCDTCHKKLHRNTSIWFLIKFKTICLKNEVKDKMFFNLVNFIYSLPL